jgi:hypothetical protein
VNRRLAGSFFVLAAVLAGAVLLAGCGNGLASASGTVTVDGKPLESGTVTFHPDDGGPTPYGTVSNGKFTVNTGQDAGLKRGSYKVTVSARTIPEPGSNETGQDLTPPKYAKPDTTPLTAEVTGRNHFEFDLKSAE